MSQQDPTGTGNGADDVSSDKAQAACLFTGVGSGRPTPRTKTMGMFGYIPDAFTSKSLEFNGDTVSRHRPAGAPAKSTSPATTDTSKESAGDVDEKDSTAQNGELGEETVTTVDRPMDIFDAVSSGCCVCEGIIRIHVVIREFTVHHV